MRQARADSGVVHGSSGRSLYSIRTTRVSGKRKGVLTMLLQNAGLHTRVEPVGGVAVERRARRG
jgi:hypothetical protein